MSSAVDPRQAQPIPPITDEQIATTGFWHSTTGTVILAVIVALVIFIVSSAADLVLLREHEPARLAIEISDGISSLVIGLLCFQLFRLQQQRRRQIRKRLEVIADMNHHVRNALQVISLTFHDGNHNEIATVRESVNRIQWALKELLPKI
jgi:hypothetical protein